MKKTLLTIILLTTALLCTADDLRLLTLRDGLAGMSVKRIAEDTTGKMWIVTSNGISLYNGQSFKNYTLPKLPNGLPNICHDIDLDHNGNVWTATRLGIFVLQRHDDTFRQVAPEISMAECILCVGDTTYVGCRSGLYVIDRRGKAESIDISAGQQRGNNSVRCLRKWGDAVYLTLRTGIIRMVQATRKIKFYPLETPSGLSRFDIYKGNAYAGTKNNGLYRLDLRTGKAVKTDFASNVINDVVAYPDGRICIASDGGGAYVISAHDGSILEQYYISEKSQLPTNTIYTFILARNGTRWLGMYLHGLAHSKRSHHQFHPYEWGTFTTRGMNVKRALTDGHIRLIAINGGFWMVDEQANTSHYYDTGTWKMQNINTLYEHDGFYYIGSYDSGLLRLDKQTRQLSRQPDCPQLSYATIADMATDQKGRLWIASSEGLFVVEHNKVVRNYTEKNSKLPMGITGLCFDQKGNGWIGGWNSLCIYLSQEDDFKVKDFPEGFFNNMPDLRFSISGNTIYAHNLYKIFYTDPEMKHFGEIQLPTDILSERCCGFLPDKNGICYITTEKGLFSIDRNKHTVVHFSERNGITGTAVNPPDMDDKHIWLGTTDGLLVADKQQLEPKNMSKTMMPIEIDQLSTGDHVWSNGKLLQANDQREIAVGWNLMAQRLYIRPTILDFARHEDEICEYRIDRQEWHKQQIGQLIDIKGLTLGRHTLDIRLTGMEQAVRYTIYTYPTTLFYLEAALLIIATGLFFWWFRWRRNTKHLISEHRQTEQALLEEIKNQNEQKYQRARNSDKELAHLFQQVDSYVKKHKPYLNKDSKMSDIATALGVSPSLLSQMFTLHVKESYYDYINRYRLETFKQLIAEGQHKHYTISALYEQCGFKKTSFFTTFRKVEGMTPTEFLERYKKGKR